jgi:hypothetical protein
MTTLDFSNKYSHTVADPWRWRAAQGPDIPAIVDLIVKNYEQDGTGIAEINAVEGSRNLMFAIVNQMYNPKKEMITVAELTEDKTILAFTWCQRDVRQPWSTEEMIVPKLLSVDLGMTARCRMALCVQGMLTWERWAQVCKVAAINSSSMRRDWQSFMHLHERMGYTVRGSQAFKRVNTVTIHSETNRIILP